MNTVYFKLGVTSRRRNQVRLLENVILPELNVRRSFRIRIIDEPGTPPKDEHLVNVREIPCPANVSGPCYERLPGHYDKNKVTQDLRTGRVTGNLGGMRERVRNDGVEDIKRIAGWLNRFPHALDPLIMLDDTFVRRHRWTTLHPPSWEQHVAEGEV